MYKQIAFSALAAGAALAAPAPQSTSLCNPAAFPTGEFQLGGFNPTDSSVTPLVVEEVSRGAKILVASPTNAFNPLSNFTFDSGSGNLCATGLGCDDGATTNPLLFGSPGPASDPNGEPAGGFTLQAGDGCFSGDQTPDFLLADGGAGVSGEDDWAGWVLCEDGSGVYWNAGEAAPEGCNKVGLQLFFDI